MAANVALPAYGGTYLNVADATPSTGTSGTYNNAPHQQHYSNSFYFDNFFFLHFTYFQLQLTLNAGALYMKNTIFQWHW